MLDLKQQDMVVEHINFRPELHGTDKVTAVDVKLSANMPPSILDQIVPGMREAFFKPANSAGQMSGGLQLTFPDLENKFAVDKDIPGYILAIAWGANGKTLDYADVEVGKIRLELINGGAVTLTVRLQIGGDPLDLAQLVPLLSLKLPVTLTPPPAEQLPKDHPDAKSPKSVAAVTGGDGAAEPGALADDPFEGSDLAQDPPPGITQRTVEGLAEVDANIAAGAKRDKRLQAKAAALPRTEDASAEVKH